MIRDLFRKPSPHRTEMTTMATRTKPGPATTATLPPPETFERTAAGELERLAAERADLEVLAGTDTLTRAGDPAEWRIRSTDRQGRLAEIETEVRRLRQWGELFLTHPDAIREYETTAQRVKAGNRHLTEHFAWADRSAASHGSGATSRDLQQWFDAMTRLAQSLPLDTEQARHSLTAELNAWARLRMAFAHVTLAELGRAIPIPEYAGSIGQLDQLPPWLTISANRGDK